MIALIKFQFSKKTLIIAYRPSMGLGFYCVILANQLVSLITSSTTDPRLVNSQALHVECVASRLR